MHWPSRQDPAEWWQFLNCLYDTNVIWYHSSGLVIFSSMITFLKAFTVQAASRDPLWLKEKRSKRPEKILDGLYTLAFRTKEMRVAAC